MSFFLLCVLIMQIFGTLLAFDSYVPLMWLVFSQLSSAVSCYSVWDRVC